VQKTGGAKTHTLTTTQMPSHTHTLRNNVSNGASTQSTRYGVTYNNSGWTQNFVMSNSTETSGNNIVATGGGGAHNNLQPYITVYFWRRTA
ncbi:MAG: hypothetical protein LBS33_03395, partial [Streptococcaceae bacterium]|nr:hypothetical protein [Streptococcaceae bacterium]MDR1567711.1 hypothetical protein [Streptococcaceae bacterium]